MNQLLNSEWLSCLTQFTKVFVGFSGGLDSTVLLHVLGSYPLLRSKLVAVHINHGISPQASSWQMHCEQFCRHSGVTFLAQSVEFDRSANIEERARDARYAVLSSLLTDEDCLVLGHHQDDQAETVLLQLFRGTGIDGLSAMAELSCLGAGKLVRPFLNNSRQQLEHYAELHQIAWIEDESNQDTHYSRNYLRHQIMPLLLEKWPGVKGNITRTAFHCQQAQANLDVLARVDHPELMSAKTSLSVEPLQKLTFERIVNVLRVWLKNNQIQLPSTATFQRLIHEMIFARTDAAPEVSWGKILVRRYQKYLYLDKKDSINLPACIEWSEFPSPLSLKEAGITLRTQKVNQGLVIPKDAKIYVRFRQGGELFYWHGQTKHVKKLFQEWQIPPWLRERTPLLYVNGELAAIIGYAISDLFFKKDVSNAWILSIESLSH